MTVLKLFSQQVKLAGRTVIHNGQFVVVDKTNPNSIQLGDYIQMVKQAVVTRDMANKLIAESEEIISGFDHMVTGTDPVPTQPSADDMRTGELRSDMDVDKQDREHP